MLVSSDRWRSIVTDVLGQRQANFPAALAADPERPIRPIDILQSHSDDVTGTQTDTAQQQEDGLIANTAGRLQIAGIENAVQFIGSAESFHWGTVGTASARLGQHSPCAIRNRR